MAIQVSGLDQIVNNLNKSVMNIKDNTKEGLDSAAQFVMLEAKSRAPHDTSDLKDSAFHDPFTTSRGFGETVGFDKDNKLGYAAAIHEKEQKTNGTVPRTRRGSVGHFWDQGEPHFLSKAITENFTIILNIIAKFAGKQDGPK